MKELIKATFKTGSATMVSLLLGAATNKILAWFLGPSGLGLFSLIRQTEQMAKTLASFNGETAIVQGIAGLRKDEELRKFLSTVLHLFIFGSLFVSLLLIIGAPQLALLLDWGKNTQMVSLIRWLSVPLIFNVGFVYLGSILNGHRAIGILAVLQIMNSGITAILAYPVAILVGNGYFLSLIGLLAVSSGFALGVAVYFCHRYDWISPIFRMFWQGFSRAAAVQFFKISITTIFTGLFGIGTLLAIRALISVEYGLETVGIFEVAWTLSIRYIMLLLSSFSTYYLPTLSLATDTQTRRELILRLLRLSIIVGVPMIIVLVVLKPVMIEIFYSREFNSACQIIRWMLVGDYLKITSWIFGMPMLAFPNMKAFFWSELIANAWLLGFSALTILHFKWVEGIGLGFLLLYIGHLAYTFYYTQTRLNYFSSRIVNLQWLIGLLLIISASWDTWNDLQVNWFSASFWIIAGTIFSLLTTSQQEKTALLDLALRKSKKLFGP